MQALESGALPIEVERLKKLFGPRAKPDSRVLPVKRPAHERQQEDSGGLTRVVRGEGEVCQSNLCFAIESKRAGF
jgi:hypothetical protein